MTKATATSDNSDRDSTISSKALKDWLESRETREWVMDIIKLPDHKVLELLRILHEHHCSTPYRKDTRVIFNSRIRKTFEIGLNAKYWELYIKTAHWVIDYPENIFGEPLSEESKQQTQIYNSRANKTRSPVKIISY
ncbi:MAG: hypothetical protein V7L23_23190 [Nostoc sp.]|uniref:hypothetical protein n=1 Tax=Nostoc sp. TaxID=1180 RepID=UPI002FF34922